MTPYGTGTDCYALVPTGYGTVTVRQIKKPLDKTRLGEYGTGIYFTNFLCSLLIVYGIFFGT